MPAVVLAKKDVKIKPKTSVRRVNAKGNDVKHVGRKNLGRKENARPRGSSKLELDDMDSGSEIYGRKVAWNRNPTERKRRRAVRNDDVGEATKSPGVRAHSKRTLSPSTKEKSSDVELSRRKPSNRRQRDIDEDESDEEIISGRTAREIRDRSGKKDAIHGSRYSGRKESKSKRLEAEAEKLKRKGKRVGEVKSNEINKGNNEDKVFDKEEKIKDQVDQTVKQKPFKFQARMLDKTGKKIRGHKKPSDDKPEVTEASLKKRKRVIKIDPYDLSNKRLDDGKSSNVHTEKAVEKEIELSKNAQFRAIQPSPSILSFVEDNLLGRRRLMELQNAGYNVKLSAPLDNVPFSTSAEREHIEENVFRNKLEFFAAAKISSSFPPPMIPEIAFAGRSNIGKSSLLNALTRQWGVVRTSDKPGHTQTINFFRLASKLCLVDLPGYGFAYAKEEVKDAWEELVKEYVSTRIGLKRVCLLIDTKWGMKPRDHELIDLMERSQTPYQIVLTKTDVAFPINVARRAMQVQESLKANKLVVNPLMMVSSKSGAGIRSLRTVLAKIARFAKL